MNNGNYMLNKEATEYCILEKRIKENGVFVFPLKLFNKNHFIEELPFDTAEDRDFFIKKIIKTSGIVEKDCIEK